MKVICIDDIGKDSIKLQITAGETYNAISCPRKGMYIILEHQTFMGELVCYEQRRFIPLSNIDEMELVKERELINL